MQALSLRHSLLAVLVASLVFLAGCDESDDLPSPEAIEASLQAVQIGDVTIAVEIAYTRKQQLKGVMFREGIEDGHGMIFPLTPKRRASFHMTNVDFPIDIGFFTEDGVLREVLPLYANDTQSRQSKRSDIAFALETRRRWFADNNVRPGDVLDLEPIRAAIKAHSRR